MQIYEIGSEGGLPYFSLEFVEGGSLAAQIKGARKRLARRPNSFIYSPGPSITPIAPGSFTATSSRPTS